MEEIVEMLGRIASRLYSINTTLIIMNSALWFILLFKDCSGSTTGIEERLDKIRDSIRKR